MLRENGICRRTGVCDRVKALADELPRWWRRADLRAAWAVAHPGDAHDRSGAHVTAGAISALVRQGVVRVRGVRPHQEFSFARRGRRRVAFRHSPVMRRWLAFRSACGLERGG